MPYSYAVTTASGSSAQVVVPFPYIAQEHVHVTVNDVLVDDTTLVWPSAGQITLPSTPTAGQSIRVYRTTPADDLVATYANPAVFSAIDVNNSLRQLLYVLQEAFDITGDPAIINVINAAVTATANYRDAAAASATAAATSETNAATSETNAATSATNAAASAAAAQLSSAFSNTYVSKTVSAGVDDSDKGKTIVLNITDTGVLIFQDPNTYANANHANIVKNASASRAHRVRLYAPGGGSYVDKWLYPGENLIVFRDSSGWNYFASRRWRLSSNLTLYAAASGYDDANNDGLSAASPISRTEAVNRLKKDIDIAGWSVILQLADGSYSGEWDLFGPWVGSHVITINGNVANPNLVILTNPGGTAVYVKDYCAVTFTNLKAHTAASLFVTEQTGICDLGSGVYFGDATAAQMRTADGGFINQVGVTTIVGGNGCAYHMFADFGGYIKSGSLDYQFPGGGINWTSGFAWAQRGGQVYFDTGATYSGAGVAAASTTKKYFAQYAGRVSLNGVTLPGGVAGSADAATFGLAA